MNYIKKAVAAAVTTALGSTGAAQAADIVTMTIQDVSPDNDGVSGAFAFGPPGSTGYAHFFDGTSSITFTPFFGAPVVIAPTGPIVADGTGQGTATFTAGFIFTGATPFLPASLNGTGTGLGTTTPDGIDGSINASDTVLTFSQFHWGGQFGGEYFPLSPAGGNTNVAGALGAWQGETECAVSSANVCYQLRWDAFIVPQGGFFGPTIWQLEGVATLDAAITAHTLVSVPVPAAVWLFGSGLLGLVGVARRKIKA